MNFEFKCPKCGASPHEHGRGGIEKCVNPIEHYACEGLICDCDSRDFPRSDEPDHGTTLENPCTEAHCYHCGWSGTHPKAPKGLQAWEKKALAAGWKMPETRQKELE